jgi:hypothetical protein
VRRWEESRNNGLSKSGRSDERVVWMTKVSLTRRQRVATCVEAGAKRGGARGILKKRCFVSN